VRIRLARNARLPTVESPGSTDPRVDDLDGGLVIRSVGVEGSRLDPFRSTSAVPRDPES